MSSRLSYLQKAVCRKALVLSAQSHHSRMISVLGDTIRKANTVHTLMR